MTPTDLVAQWFAKYQQGVAGNVRFITLAQIDLLRQLAEQQDEFAQSCGELSAIQRGHGRSFVWMPKGRDKYVITAAQDGRRNTITRLANIGASGAGKLFE